DIKIPLTIEGIGENARILDFKVNKTTKNFKPTVKLKDNKIEIHNETFHNEDTIDIGVYLESFNTKLKLNQRFLNVNSNIKEFYDNKKNFVAFFSILLIMLFFAKLIFNSYKENSVTEKEYYFYNTEFKYDKILIKDDENDFNDSSLADSLYFDNLKKTNSYYDTILDKDGYSNLDSNAFKIPSQKLRNSIDSINS